MDTIVRKVSNPHSRFDYGDAVFVNLGVNGKFCGMVTKVHLSKNKVTYDVSVIVAWEKDSKNRHKQTRIANIDEEFVSPDEVDEKVAQINQVEKFLSFRCDNCSHIMKIDVPI